MSFYRMSMALLLAVTTTGCARFVTAPLGARNDAAARKQAEVHAQAFASKELAGILGDHPLPAEASGLSTEFLRQIDTNGNGLLESGEKRSAFREIWSAMVAVANERAKGESLPPPSMVTPQQEYQVRHSLAFTPATAEVYIDAGEIMPAVFQALQEARDSIWMDLFLLGGSEGLKLAELLVAKSHQGLDVRIIHDPGYGLAGAAHAQIVPVIRYLLAHGVQVRSYPLAYMPRRRGHPLANRFQIDHNKFLIVDRRTAMVGTMNLIDLGVMNHDVYVKVQGDVAHELAAIHSATWQLRGSKPPVFSPSQTPVPQNYHLLKLGEGAALAAPPNATARVTKTDIDQQDTKTLLIEAIEESKKSVDIAIFEFGDVDVAQALIQAYQRGVAVRVLADRNANYHKYLDAFKNLRLYGTPNLLTVSLLHQAGVPTKWYVPQLADQELHMKLALFDGERAMVGSTNFTQQAFTTFRETNLDLKSPRVVEKLELMFQKDWDERAKPASKANFQDKCIVAAVRAFDKFRLSWW
ncbi:MAG: phosphatidylserine/phosphatidylglycerophosphate/cardiolipin synthase family protein [Candidatus Sericytochromatia bacterium]|nr:phosphatidylserine/phosphatidylglycerophosphate/cardiolipin synthase family protein [Candidatus Sericytochromatia bacterium]